MKTIDEAAKEYKNQTWAESVVAEWDSNELKQFCESDFRAGVEFAQRWIPTEECVPEFEGEEYQVLVKGHKDNPDKVICWTVGIAENESIIRTIFTHWRPITLK